MKEWRTGWKFETPVQITVPFINPLDSKGK